MSSIHEVHFDRICKNINLVLNRNDVIIGQSNNNGSRFTLICLVCSHPSTATVTDTKATTTTNKFLPCLATTSNACGQVPPLRGGVCGHYKRQCATTTSNPPQSLRTTPHPHFLPPPSDTVTPHHHRRLWRITPRPEAPCQHYLRPRGASANELVPQVLAVLSRI